MANPRTSEKIFKTLLRLGFTENEAQVYVYLTTESRKNAKEIAEAVNLHTKRLYYILKKLHNNGVVTVSLEHPSRFSAVLFEKVLDLLIKTREEQQKALLASKKEVLSTWRSITEKDDEKKGMRDGAKVRGRENTHAYVHESP